MNKKSLTKNTTNKKYKKVVNIFSDGGSKVDLGNVFGSISSGLSGVAEAAIANAKTDTREADNAIEAVNNYQPATSSLDALADSYNSINFADSEYNYRDFMVSPMQGLANMGKAAFSGATSGASIGGGWGALAGGVAGILGSGAGWLMGKSKAKAEAERLERESLLSNTFALARAEDARDDIKLNDYNNFRRNVAAKGGRIHTMKDNIFNNGGLMHQHGGIFSNGIVFIDNGGTHEQNPFEGVQIGVDAQGIPNMVEEGEVIWQDYVFSNRLKPTKEFKDKYKIKGETFADIAKEMQKESEERPNDPISKTGLEDSMMKLMLEQEKVKSVSERNKLNNMFKNGGKKTNIGRNKKNKFAWGGYPFEDEDESWFDYSSGMSPDVVDAMNTEAEFLKSRQSGMSDDVVEAMKEEAAFLSKRQSGMSDGTNQEFNGKIGPTVTFSTESGGGGGDDPKSRTSWLRYAPAFGSAIGVFSDLLGLTNKPDYSNVSLIKDATDNIKPVGYTPLTTKLKYTPFDTQFYSSKLAEQNAATKRAIQNTAQTSGAAIAGLLTSDYNTQGKMGDLFRQAEEYNQAQRERVAGFNRQTDAMNSEMAMKAAIANQSADELRLKSAITQAQMRDQADTYASAAKSANLTNMFDNLGAIGKENFIMDMLERNPALLYNWLGEYKGKACGGKINRRRRK